MLIPVVQAFEAVNKNEKIHTIVEDYFEIGLSKEPLRGTALGLGKYNDLLGNPKTQKDNNRLIALNQHYLDKLKGIDKSQLSAQKLLTFKLFEYDLRMQLKGSQFPAYLLPFNQMEGIHLLFIELASGLQPLESVKDYENFLSRGKSFPKYIDNLIFILEEGIDSGVVLPKVIVKKIIKQLSQYTVDTASSSVFYLPIKKLKLERKFTNEIIDALDEQYLISISGNLLPAYRKLHKFMAKVYLPSARKSIGLSQLPNGKLWYEFQIEHHTTIPLLAKDIHSLGEKEVKRNLQQIEEYKNRLGFNGTLHEFFTYIKTDSQFFFNDKSNIVPFYQSLKEYLDKNIPLLFNAKTIDNYLIKAIEPYREQDAASAHYQNPAVDGSRLGTFYLNTFDLNAQPKYIAETLILHEAAPGHHFQIINQLQLSDIPSYRLHNYFTAYDEGWALYAEGLGKELGMFEDPMMMLGHLMESQLRAMRLVVDTGIHAFNWSRQNAITYMMNNSAMSLVAVEAEVDRYIALPGQALSYQIGKKAILDLRKKAAFELGKEFNIKKFHHQILKDGQLPLILLKEKIIKWINAEKQRSN